MGVSFEVICKYLKGQCHEIFDHFWGLKDSTWAPYDQAKTSCENFRFRGDIQSQRLKIGFPHSQRLRGHLIFSLYTEIFIFLNYCYWICKHIQIPFFCMIVPLSSVRSLQSFPRVFTYSLTSLTLRPRSH